MVTLEGRLAGPLERWAGFGGVSSLTGETGVGAPWTNSRFLDPAP